MNRSKNKLFNVGPNDNNLSSLRKKSSLFYIKNNLFFSICFLSILHFNSLSQTTQTYTTTGLSNWPVPNCATSVTVEVWGAGGGGGGGDIDTYSGSGGGGGGYSRSIVSVVGGTVCELYVGTGGTGGKNSNGQDGEDSWFMNKTILLAKGGQGGGTGINIVVGKGGTKGIGDITFSGGNGGKAYIPVELNTSGGGGGSSAGVAASGYNGTDGENGLVNAPGGTAPRGGGAGGNGCGKGGAPTPDCGGFPGSIPGGGGGGGNDDIVLGIGGNGAQGQIKLTWMTSDSWFTNKATEICLGNTFTISPVSGLNGDRFPPGTTYSWDLPTVTGDITGATAQTSQPFISQTLVNQSTSVQTATYLIKTSTGCNFTLTVTVYPLPQLINSLTPEAICSGTLFNYVPKGTREDLLFIWKRATIKGIAQPGITGTGTINELLTNTTDSPINVTYSYTTTSSGCNGTEQKVVVSVLPLPQLSSLLNPPAICSGTTFSYTPTGTIVGSTFTWTRAAINGITQTGSIGSASINEVLTNATELPINVTYVFTTTAKGCAISTQNVIVTVNPIPQLTGILTPFTVCSGTSVSFNPGNIAGTTYEWKRASVIGILQESSTGVGIINETLTDTTKSPISVTYIFTATAKSCKGKEQNLLVIVKPLPQLNNLLNSFTICSGTILSYTPTGTISGSTFSWSRSAVNGITQAASSGTGNINETLTNITASPINVSYTYTVTANGCAAKPINVVATINPIPQLNSTLNPTTICSGTTFNYIPTSAFSTITVGWKRAAINGITQAAASGTGNISELLTNTTLLPINVTYAFTTATNNCEGKTQYVVATVNPLPDLHSTYSPVTICSGANVLFNTDNTAGTTYEWSRASVNGILQTSSSGVGSINEPLTNITLSPINVTYIYIAIAKGCKSKEQNLMVTVNTLPQLNSVPNIPAICSGTTFSYTATGAIVGSTFTWARTAITGISQTASSGSGNINETLTNTTLLPINVTYVYTAKANGCTGKPQNVIVTINPIPQLNNILNPTTICSGGAFTYTPISKTEGVTFSWIRSTMAGIVPEGSKGEGKINESLTNSTMSPINVTYVYNAMANGCKGTDQQVMVTVNPLSQLNSTLNSSAICSGKSFNYTPTSTVAGTRFIWNRASIKGIEQSSSSGTGNINEVITNTTSSPVNVTYSYEAMVNGCKGKEQKIIVTVNPMPQLSSTLTPPVICSGTFFKYNATGTTSDAHFSWKRTSTYGVSQASSSGTGNVNELLSNTTTAPIDVTYVYTITSNNCEQNQNVTVTVKPLPKATITGNSVKCINDVSPDILFTGNSSKPPYKFTYKINGGKKLEVTSDENGTATISASTSVAGDYTYSLLSVAESSSELNCSQVQTGSAMVKIIQLETELLGTIEVPLRGAKPTITLKATGGKPPYTFIYIVNDGENRTKSTMGSVTSATIVAPTDVAGDFVYTLVNIKDANGLSCASDATAIITVNPPNQNSKAKSSSGGAPKIKAPNIAPKNLIKLNRRYKLGK